MDRGFSILFTCAAFGTVLVILDRDSLRGNINDLLGIYNLVGVVLAVVPEVGNTVTTNGVNIVELCAAAVADVLLDFHNVGLFRSCLSVRCPYPCVGVSRLRRLACRTGVARAGTCGRFTGWWLTGLGSAAVRTGVLAFVCRRSRLRSRTAGIVVARFFFGFGCFACFFCLVFLLVWFFGFLFFFGFFLFGIVFLVFRRSSYFCFRLCFGTAFRCFVIAPRMQLAGRLTGIERKVYWLFSLLSSS